MIQSTIEAIEQDVKAYDKFQVETKLDYELVDEEETRYVVETYIFVPRSLDISPATYSKEDFYRDKKNYIRLKTPTMLLRDFTESPLSPLTTIQKITNQVDWVNDGEVIRPLNMNFKLLAAMVYSAIREHLGHIKMRADEVAHSGKVHLFVDNLVEEFLSETQNISKQYRTLFPTFNLPYVAESLLEAYRLTDESISLLIEEGLIELLQIVNCYSRKSTRADFKERIESQIRQEIKHRRHFGYESLLDADEANETYLYRASVLKKYAASVLFLNVDIKPDGQSWNQIAQAIAAGIAMIFATAVAFWFQAQFGNFTFPLFVALVVGYMFKDRIKEMGRDIFSQRLRQFFHDRRIIIQSQDGEKLGVLKEKVDFVSEKQVPRLVMKMRDRDSFSALDNNGRGENIIRHAKEIVLYSDKIKQIFGDQMQISGINDILRYDIRAYLNKMAEPLQKRYMLTDEGLEPINCRKVYHLNIVSRYRAFQPHKEKIHKRVRLILDRSGIRRLEQVAQPEIVNRSVV